MGEKLISKPEAQVASQSGVSQGVYFCGACRRQFTVTVGTVFERPHIPLSKWLMASSLLCSSKKSVSANQIHRMIGVADTLGNATSEFAQLFRELPLQYGLGEVPRWTCVVYHRSRIALHCPVPLRLHHASQGLFCCG
jgi:hypothetical protein